MKTAAEIEAAARATLKTRSTDILKASARKMFFDSRPEADTGLRWLLEELESRMTETEFVIFCDSIALKPLAR